MFRAPAKAPRTPPLTAPPAMPSQGETAEPNTFAFSPALLAFFQFSLKSSILCPLFLHKDDTAAIVLEAADPRAAPPNARVPAAKGLSLIFFNGFIERLPAPLIPGIKFSINFGTSLANKNTPIITITCTNIAINPVGASSFKYNWSEGLANTLFATKSTTKKAKYIIANLINKDKYVFKHSLAHLPSIPSLPDCFGSIYEIIGIGAIISKKPSLIILTATSRQNDNNIIATNPPAMVDINDI